MRKRTFVLLASDKGALCSSLTDHASGITIIGLKAKNEEVIKGVIERASKYFGCSINAFTQMADVAHEYEYLDKEGRTFKHEFEFYIKNVVMKYTFKIMHYYGVKVISVVYNYEYKD